MQLCGSDGRLPPSFVFVVDVYMSVCVLIPSLSHCMPSSQLLFDVLYELFLKRAVLLHVNNQAGKTHCLGGKSGKLVKVGEIVVYL